MPVKRWFFLITLIMVCAVLSACSKEESTSPAVSNQPVDLMTEAKKIADTPTELVIAYNGATEELFNTRFGDQIRKKFPKYTITYLAGTYADIVTTAPVIDMVFSSANGMPTSVFSYNLQSNISDLIKKYNFDVSKMGTGLMDAVTQFNKGVVAAVPWTTATPVFFFNKDLFDKFGVPYPKDGMTWDEVYELTRKMTRTDNGQQYHGLTMEHSHILNFNQLSAPYFNTTTYKALFTENNYKRVFENTARFLVIPGNERGKLNVRNAFSIDQTVAMHLDISGFISAPAASMKNWDLTSFPVYPDLPGVGPSMNPDYTFITSKSKNRDAAFQVLSYIASEEYQSWSASTKGLLPILKDSEQIMKKFGAEIPGIAGKNLNAILPKTFAKMQPITPYTAIGTAELSTAVNDYVAGKDVNTVLREAVERADQKIATAQGK